ncbi:hypothetical protein BsWGS_23400 [Bradybaena similaris]
MRYYHKTNNKFHCPSINVDKLWSLLSEQSRAKYLDQQSEKAPVIDVVQAGYYKVLGKDHLPQRPVIVKAKFFSKVAEKRIKEVDGACLLSS